MKLLDVGTPRAKEHAAGALMNLATNDDNTVAPMAAGEELVKLLDVGTAGAKEHAVGAIWKDTDDTKATLMNMGAGEKLLTLLEKGDYKLYERKENATGEIVTIGWNLCSQFVLSGRHRDDDYDDDYYYYYPPVNTYNYNLNCKAI